MEETKKYHRQMEISDLIDDAIANALTRRESVETLSDGEAASIAGGASIEEAKKPVLITYPPTVAGFKPIEPPVVPIKSPIIVTVGLIALPNDKTLA